ncbi:selenium cofactor biosynthesis protein YqeC [Desulfopila sp. IMCC35008]|uniref:selenium cofactor biosynthesis protein YqeC n=1 Tax=Desulfopila sp. IMCC35008 TaxID=2653858 RepID=UPI0013D0D991|nr:selenium cofactor biosynthesis protein YqeC [Desulfopila sp. IMCC35008]
MKRWDRDVSFLAAFAIQRGDLICLSGAGGKTSLMYHLAQEARDMDFRVLVTTTTRILVPARNQYDRIDLSGMLFDSQQELDPGIYVGGSKAYKDDKITGCSFDVLQSARDRFDLVLNEADGAACKRLKGWRENEPVIPEFTTKTIGIVDINTINMVVNEHNVHRLPQFLSLTGARQGEAVTLSHLQRLIEGRKGIFVNSRGEKIVFFNRMESANDFAKAAELRNLLPQLQCFGGSLHLAEVYS